MEALSNFTTLKVGGPAQKIVHAHTEDELVEFVKAADKAGEQVLILGGGSNLLISDAGFAGTVIRVESKGNALDYDACSGGMIEVSAGEDWDKFVALTIEKGFADLELSLAIRSFGGKLMQLDLPLEQGRHHGYHDVDPDYRDKNSRKNYQRILDRFRGKNEILSPRR